MNRRKDALVAAAKDLLAVRDVVREEPGRQVGTVGYMKAEPGAPNVIPGRVEFPVELRDLDAATIERMWQHIQQRFAQTDKEEGVETRCAVINDIAPTLSDPTVQSVIREAARSTGLSTADMPSGAVHDAGEISRLAPMGMIFVPSRDGISHAPQEFSAWDDVANGTEVLYRSILKLDKQMNAR
jgi:N-carbamoyl-L-amino-acid hydrolase